MDPPESFFDLSRPDCRHVAVPPNLDADVTYVGDGDNHSDCVDTIVDHGRSCVRVNPLTRNLKNAFRIASDG